MNARGKALEEFLARTVVRRMAVCAVAALLWLAAAPPALANPPIQEMKQSTVWVECVDGAGTGFVTGEGWYVITNFHVVSGAGGGGTAQVLLSRQDRYQGKIIWWSEVPDLAILQLDRQIPRPSVTFASQDLVEDADHVYAMGFPGAAEGMVDEPSDFEVKISDGIISASVTAEDGTMLYQTTAALNPGNSGGPLFNEYGQVIGINVAKSLVVVQTYEDDGYGNMIEVLTRVPEGEGIGWAIRTEELFPPLDRLEIPYNRVGDMERMSRWWRDNPSMVWIIGAMLLSFTAMLLALTRRGRVVVREAVNVVTRRGGKPAGLQSRGPRSIGSAATGTPVLAGISGSFKDSELELDQTPLAMGRDARVCQLVFGAGESEISKRHCILTYDKDSGTFELEDTWSTNGTYLGDGTRLKPGNPYMLRPGDRFYLGDKQHMFEVRV